MVSEAGFRDRVVHHSLVSALEPEFESGFIDYSFACRKGRGSHAAVKRAQKMARRHRYFLKMDIHHYFADVNHDVLMALLANRIADEQLLWLCKVLLDSAHVPTHY